MVVKISQKEQQKLSGLKELDLQQCSFCGKITLLNLGWAPFHRLFCQTCQEEHVLCPELCLGVARNIFDCWLYQELPRVRPIEVVKPNRPYDWANCYLCGKELRGAGKTGQIKNRNNPGFWGLNTEYKILCLKCLGQRFIEQLSKSKRRSYFKYVQRGYV